MRRTGARYSPRQYFAALGYVAAQQPSVFVIYVINLIRAESARLARANESASALSAFSPPAASIVAPAVLFVRCSLFFFLLFIVIIIVGANRKRGFAAARAARSRRGRGPCRASRMQFLGAFQIFINAHGDVADHGVGDAHAAFDFGDLRSAPLDGEHNVVAFVEFSDGIGEPAAANSIDLGDRRPLVVATSLN